MNQTSRSPEHQIQRIKEPFSTRNTNKTKMILNSHKSTSTYDPNAYFEPKKNFMITNLLKKTNKFSEFDCNPFLKRDYIYEDNLKNYPLTGKYLELKNEKPYNSIFLSELLNCGKKKKSRSKEKPRKNIVICSSPTLLNSQSKYKLNHFKSPSPKKIVSAISNKLNDVKKCDSDVKTFELPDELKKRLSFYKKNKLFYEPEKNRKIENQSKNVKLCRDKEKSFKRLSDIFNRFSSAEKNFMQTKLKEKGFFVTRDSKIIKPLNINRVLSIKIPEYDDQMENNHKPVNAPHTTKVERKNITFPQI